MASSIYICISFLLTYGTVSFKNVYLQFVEYWIHEYKGYIEWTYKVKEEYYMMA